MHKRKRPIDAVMREVQTFLSEGLRTGKFTLSSLEKGAGADQTTLSRYAHTGLSRYTTQLESLCSYAKIDIYERKPVDPKSSKVLMDALRDTWDGSPGQAKQLAQIIRALGTLK